MELLKQWGAAASAQAQSRGWAPSYGGGTAFAW